MPVRIRLARFGRRNLPFYRIFVADSRSPRDGRHLEVVGHFDPLPGAQRAQLPCLAPPKRGVRVGRRYEGAGPASARRGRVRWRGRHAMWAQSALMPRDCGGAGKDGNKHIGLNFDRLRCVGFGFTAAPARRSARRPRAAAEP